MRNEPINERNRIRAARYAPGRRFDEAIDGTLKNLPGRKRFSLQRRALAASSVAAALVLFLAFCAPPIVRAAGQLYERLFGDVRQEIEDEQKRPQDERLAERVAEIESAYRAQDVEGATIQVGGVTMSVDSIRLTADMGGDDSPGWTRVTGDEADAGGVIDITVSYSAIPSFDPSRVDFTLAVDGTEIPMYVDGALKEYRDQGGQTLTEDEWNDDMRLSNSEISGDTPTTWLSFKTGDWMWGEVKRLQLKATIDGREIAIPFTFDPGKAHENAVRTAEASLARAAEIVPTEIVELEGIEANAVPVGLTGTDFGYEWAISELSYMDGELYFTMAFNGIEETNTKVAAMSFWLGNVAVDGAKTGAGSSGSDALAGGNYTAIYQYPVCCDPENLPAESVLTMTLEFGSEERVKTVSFKYNWAEKRVTLPASADEMDEWTRDARAMGETLYAQYDEVVGYDLTGLGLIARADGVTVTITGVAYIRDATRLEFYVSCEDDAKDDAGGLMGDPIVTIDGIACRNEGGSMAGNVQTGFFVSPPMSIAEFGSGETVVVEYPLLARGGEASPEVLRYEFAIDKTALPPLAME